MSSSDLLPFFEERYDEVMEYVLFLSELEKVTQGGTPRLVRSKLTITSPQQKILYSSLYLQLYNLVEATVTRCVDAVSTAAKSSGKLPQHLNENLHREWVRVIARTHTELTFEHRLQYALEMSRTIIDQLPIADFAIEIGGGGNWDDEQIYEIGKRLGCNLTLSSDATRSAKQPVRDNFGPLKLVKNRRNRLAHGSLSFVDCADGVVVAELRATAESVGKYLREVVRCFVNFIDAYEFLHPNSQPKGTP